MLRIVTGPFHPVLEQTLADELSQIKHADPLAPLAIVVPSAVLRRRVQELLVVGSHSCVLNVHVLTFHQLALRLYDESVGAMARNARGEAEPLVPRMELVGDLFFEHLLRHIAARPQTGFAGCRLDRFPSGGWAALWATIRDLKDAEVEPEALLRAIADQEFHADDQQKLRDLCAWYAATTEAARVLGVGSADDLAGLVTGVVSRSKFLKSLKGIVYYGVYDLTQRQLSLFEAVVKVSPVTLYFPLTAAPSYCVPRRFLERHMLSLAESVTNLSAPSAPAGLADGIPKAGRPDPIIMNAVGPDDEVTLVCKEILMLRETHGSQWSDIGVVARTLTPYQSALSRLFDQHRIPFTCSGGMPLLQFPATKLLLHLAALPANGFFWASVLDVLASPFYRLPEELLNGLDARPDLWRLAVQLMGITRGVEEWDRLTKAGAVQAHGVGDADEMSSSPVHIHAEQVRLLGNLVSRLIRDCGALPSQGGFRDLSDAFAKLLDRHVNIAGLAGEARPNEETPRHADAVGEVVQGVLDELRQLETIGASVTWAEWAEAFGAALERATIPFTPTDHVGIQVLDAMSARGIPFRTLFVLGLNEKVFPRFIHEDAFLRDQDRRIVEETLGNKIDEKLGGYEEESLLFGLLRDAARDRLYLLYQRADHEGRPLVMSPLLMEYGAGCRDAGSPPDVRLPRRAADRYHMPQFSPDLLTGEELAQWLILQDWDPGPVLAACGREPALFEQGFTALRELEGAWDRPGPYDGDTGFLSEVWTGLAGRGLAPTPLQQYACCPFQYFSAQALGLESVREPVRGELQPVEIGRLCHDLLRTASERLIKTGWPKNPLDDATLRTEVQSTARRLFQRYAQEHGTGYGLLWEMAQETVVELVVESLALDQQDYRSSGFAPVGFEVEAEGSLEGVVSPDLEVRTVKGRIDRIDRRDAPPGVRVIDYKYKIHGEMESKDRDLLTAAVRGFRLQPPFYVLMQASQDGLITSPPDRVEFRFLAPKWEPRVQSSSFDAVEWKGESADLLRNTVGLLLNGVKAGRFPILPDRYCDTCAFRTACRRNHGPSWWRAYQAESAQDLRGMRKQKVRRSAARDE